MVERVDQDHINHWLRSHGLFPGQVNEIRIGPKEASIGAMTVTVMVTDIDDRPLVQDGEVITTDKTIPLRWLPGDPIEQVSLWSV